MDRAVPFTVSALSSLRFLGTSQLQACSFWPAFSPGTSPQPRAAPVLPGSCAGRSQAAREVIHTASFSWFTSLRGMSSRFTHIVTSSRIFFFTTEYYSIIYITYAPTHAHGHVCICIRILYVYTVHTHTPHFLHPFIHYCTFRLFPCLGCCQ